MASLERLAPPRGTIREQLGMSHISFHNDAFQKEAGQETLLSLREVVTVGPIGQLANHCRVPCHLFGCWICFLLEFGLLPSPKKIQILHSRTLIEWCLQHSISAKCKSSFLYSLSINENRVVLNLFLREFSSAALVNTDVCWWSSVQTQKLSTHHEETVQEATLLNPEGLICRGSHCSVSSWTESLHLCPDLALGLWLGSLLTQVVLLTQPLTSVAFTIQHVSVGARWKCPFFGEERAPIQKKSNPPTPEEGRGQRKCR